MGGHACTASLIRYYICSAHQCLWRPMATGAQFGANEDRGGLASNWTVLQPPAAGDQILLTPDCESMNYPIASYIPITKKVGMHAGRCDS